MAISTIGEVVRTHGTRAAGRAGAAVGRRRVDDLRRSSTSGPSRWPPPWPAEGVGSQDRVAIYDKNCPEYFELQYGAALLNAVLTPVNWRLAGREVAYIVNDAQTKVLAVGQEFLPVLDADRGRSHHRQEDRGDRRRRRPARIVRGLA